MLRRILFFIPSLLFIALIGFVIAINAPGDPVQTLLHDVTGTNAYTSSPTIKDQEKQLRHRLGLDLPVFYFSMHSLAEVDAINQVNVDNSKLTWRGYVPIISFHLHNQFHRWLFGDGEFSKGIIRGDFGISYTTQQPVIKVLQSKIKWSLLLSITSLLISLLIAIPLGTYSIFHPESFINKFISGFKNFAYATPVFWLATLLLILFANPSMLKIFPASGVQPAEGFGDASFLKSILISSWYLILPLICYSYASIALLAATVQTSLKETMHEEYIKTAFAKGLNLKQVVNRHAMRNVLLPLITLIANIFPTALGGSVIIENIFSIPGMGNEITNAVYTQNYPVIVAVVTITGFLTLTGYLLADIVYRIADPEFVSLMKINFKNIFGGTIAHRKSKIALRILIVIFILGLLAPIISNDQPLYVNYKGQNLFPAFHFRDVDANKVDDLYLLNNLYNTDWKTTHVDYIIFPPFTFGNGTFDYLNSDYVSPFEKQKFKNAEEQIIEMPFRYRHWLGTGKKGEDVLAVLFYGAQYTFIISCVAVAIATFIGLLFGIFSGYYGNYHFKTSLINVTGFLTGIVFGYFYGFHLRSFTISLSFASSQLSGVLQVLFSSIIVLSVAVFCYLICDWISELFSVKKKFYIPLDSIISKLIELFVSIPALILIISFTALMKPSLLTIILVIGLTGWTTIARLVRAEMMKIRNLGYIESARALGFNHPYIIIKHALPNISSSLYVMVIFTMAAAIILESSLTFLGIGVPHDVITWGSLLTQSKENFSAWWISLFPGGMIFITLYCFNKLADNFRNSV